MKIKFTKEFFKRQYKNLILVAMYLIMANVVYIVWFNDLWHLWYVDVITFLAITALGLFIGYKYILSEEKKLNPDFDKVDAKDAEIKVAEIDAKDSE